MYTIYQKKYLILNNKDNEMNMKVLFNLNNLRYFFSNIVLYNYLGFFDTNIFGIQKATEKIFIYNQKYVDIDNRLKKQRKN